MRPFAVWFCMWKWGCSLFLCCNAILLCVIPFCRCGLLCALCFNLCGEALRHLVFVALWEASVLALNKGGIGSKGHKVCACKGHLCHIDSAACNGGVVAAIFGAIESFYYAALQGDAVYIRYSACICHKADYALFAALAGEVELSCGNLCY